MPIREMSTRVEAGDWRTLVTLWNTTATGLFRGPAGAQIKVRYGDGWPVGRDSQRQTLDGVTEKRLSVGRWSALVGRMQVRVRQDTVIRWTYVVEGP